MWNSTHKLLSNLGQKYLNTGKHANFWGIPELFLKAAKC